MNDEAATVATTVVAVGRVSWRISPATYPTTTRARAHRPATRRRRRAGRSWGRCPPTRGGGTARPGAPARPGPARRPRARGGISSQAPIGLDDTAVALSARRHHDADQVE